MCLRNVFACLYYLPTECSIPNENIPGLKHELPNEFIRENDHFYYLWACNVAWMGESIHCAPKAQLDDGFCDLIKMKNSAGKCNLMMQLFNQDSGDYYTSEGNLKPNSGLEYIKTKCWRLIPKNNLSENDDVSIDRNLPRFFSIDGERYPIEPIQIKTLRKSLKIFCLSV